MSSIKLFERRLIIVTGKGGVGKTTLACALALGASSTGKKVLLAEVDSKNTIARLFHIPALSYKETEIHQNVWGLSINPVSCIREYLSLQLRISRLANALTDIPLAQQFINVSPGLGELMTLGKIWHMEQLKNDSNTGSQYDLIILDAPAAGHGTPFLQVPKAAISAVHFGPIHTNSRRIWDLLGDAKKTALMMVTLPEEMPVKETIEFHTQISQEVAIPMGPVLINGIYTQTLSPSEWAELERMASDEAFLKALEGYFHLPRLGERLLASCRSEDRKRRLQETYVQQLRDALPHQELIQVPALPTGELNIQDLEKLSRILLSSLESN